jgi:hypothetical protein
MAGEGATPPLDGRTIAVGLVSAGMIATGGVLGPRPERHHTPNSSALTASAARIARRFKDCMLR